MLENQTRKTIWDYQNSEIGFIYPILDDILFYLSHFPDRFKDGKVELAKLINDSVKGGKSIDQKILIQMVEIMVMERNLVDYVQSIHFDFSHDFAVASYDDVDRDIHVFMKKLESNFKKASHYMEGEERAFFPYCIIAFFLAHEIEHSNQLRNMNEKDDITSKILKISQYYSRRYYSMKWETLNFISKTIEKNKYAWYYQLYYRNHGYAPEERIADIYGKCVVLDLIEQLEKETEIQFEQLNKNFINSLFLSLFSGYDQAHGYSPTEYYLKVLKLQKEYMKITKLTETLGLSEKLILGLYMSPLEINTLQNQPEALLKTIRKLYSKKN